MRAGQIVWPCRAFLFLGLPAFRRLLRRRLHAIPANCPVGLPARRAAARYGHPQAGPAPACWLTPPNLSVIASRRCTVSSRHGAGDGYCFRSSHLSGFTGSFRIRSIRFNTIRSSTSAWPGIPAIAGIACARPGSGRCGERAGGGSRWVPPILPSPLPAPRHHPPHHDAHQRRADDQGGGGGEQESVSQQPRSRKGKRWHGHRHGSPPFTPSRRSRLASASRSWARA